MRSDEGFETLIAEEFARFALHLRNSIRVQNETISHAHGHFLVLVGSAESMCYLTAFYESFAGRQYIAKERPIIYIEEKKSGIP